MNFSDDFLDEIKNRNEIGDIISEYVNLSRRGRIFSALCPFHLEKTASFFVYPESQSFYCFGCGAGGDVITFMMLAEKLAYLDALEVLANRAGLSFPQNLPQKNGAGFNKKKLFFEINRESAKFFNDFLFSSSGKHLLNYILKRGIKKETAVKFDLGASSSNHFELTKFLKDKGFSESEIVFANLGVKTKSGGIIDRFCSRIMFPIIDLKGNVTGFGGRSVGESEPKYINTSDTPVFKKSSNLFALNFAKKSSEKSFILTEGYMDAISLHQIGFTNAVAALGTAFTYEQAKLISKFSKEIYISYDSDGPGKKAAERTAKILRELEIVPKIILIPNAKDPDEFIKTNGGDSAVRFRILLENSKNDIEYRISEIKNKNNLKNPEERVNYLKEAAKILSEIKNPVERDVYISEICSQTEIQKDALRVYIKNLINGKKKANIKNEIKIVKSSVSGINIKNEIKTVNPSASGINLKIRNSKINRSLRAAYIEELLISFIIKKKEIMESILNLNTNDFITEFNKKIFEKLIKISKEGKEINITSISHDLNFEEKGRIAKIANFSAAEYVTRDEIAKYAEMLKLEKEMENIKNIDKNEIPSIMDKLKNSKK
jgi:DNA primase